MTHTHTQRESETERETERERERERGRFNIVHCIPLHCFVVIRHQAVQLKFQPFVSAPVKKSPQKMTVR